MKVLALNIPRRREISLPYRTSPRFVAAIGHNKALQARRVSGHLGIYDVDDVNRPFDNLIIAGQAPFVAAISFAKVGPAKARFAGLAAHACKLKGELM